MKSHRIVQYLPSAVRDIEEIFEYISQDNPKAIQELLQKFDSSISALAQFPQKGSIPKDDRLRRKGYRELVIEKYLVFYVIQNDSIEIRRIIHGSRKYSFLL